MIFASDENISLKFILDTYDHLLTSQKNNGCERSKFKVKAMVVSKGSLYLKNEHLKIDRQDIMFFRLYIRPSVRLSVHHTLTGATLYSAYLIEPLQLNLDNGRIV